MIIDVGASELIASGEIKLKHGGEIERFTPKGLLFDDKTELEADVVVFATGFVVAFDALTHPSPTLTLAPPGTATPANSHTSSVNLL